jgi:AcrR family transcriptional regulator
MHVGDRRALVVALAARLLERISATVEEALDGANGGRGMVRALVRAQLITVAAHPNLLAFVTGTRAGEGANPATLEFGMRAAASLVPGLALARERAGLDPSVADTWAHAIVGTLHMVSLWWLFGPGPRKPVDQLADELTGLLWAGLGGT